jgi:dolichol-phosphate mannosyltransferase
MPVGNERDTIRELLHELLAQLAPQDAIFCVLDRIATDGTREIIESETQRNPQVRLVWRPENRCVVDAYFTGYRAALDSGCDWILEMDAGFSHRPSDVPQFFEAMAEGYDYVGGSRFMTGGAHRSPLSRVLLSWGGSRLAARLLRSPMTDMTSGFQCFNRRTMQKVVEQGVLSRANFFQTEIRYAMLNFRWKEVPIIYSNDRPTVGRSAIRESLKILFRLARERKDP